MRAWDLTTRQAVVVLGGDAGPVSAVAIGPDARQVVSGHQDGAIRLWNLKARNARALTAHTSEVEDLAFCPDARHLLSAGKDKTVRLWDVVSGQCTRTFAHAVPVHAVCASPDGTAFYSGGADGVVRGVELDWEPDDAEPPEWDAGPGRSSRSSSPDAKRRAKDRSRLRRWVPSSPNFVRAASAG